MPKSKLRQKQKQQQKQNVVQKVIIKLDKEGKKIKVKRRRQKKQIVEGEDDFQKYNPYWRQLPPPSVFINAPTAPQVPQQLFNPPKEIPSINPPPRIVPFLEDVGNIGTEGRVDILDIPTKREQLDEMIVPVPKEDLRKYNEDFMNMLDERRKYFKSLQEPLKPPFMPEQNIKMNIEPKVIESPILRDDEIKVKRTRRTKKEMEENRYMIREDVAGYNLRLAQFEPAFKPKPFTPEEEASVISGITLSQTQEPTEVSTEVLYGTKKPRRNSLLDLSQRYYNLTGEIFQKRRGFTVKQLKELVERMEQNA